MTVMTLLNCNHLLITQAELCLKGTFVKGTFFIFMKILRENAILSLLVLSILKLLIEIKNYVILYFHTSL